MGIKNKDAGQKNRKDTDRNIDIENPAPTVTVGKPSSQNGTEHRRDHDAKSPEAHCLASILWGKDLHENGLRERLQSATTSALNAAKEDEQGKRWRESA